MGASPATGGDGPAFQPEDRAAFAEVVDEVLRSEPLRRGLRTAPEGTAALLRDWALASAEEVARPAAAEYRELCRVRAGGGVAGAAPGSRTPGGSGGGLLAALAVLVPLVAAAAAVIFLLLGYVLTLVETQRDVGESLVVTGWSGAAVAAVTGAAGMCRLLITARRHSKTGPRTDDRAEDRTGDGAARSGTDGRAEAARRRVAAAREAWRAALRDRAVLPYLRARLPEAERALGLSPANCRRGDGRR
ncbi:hypothetical protein [Streptomyces albus]|uniref:hypothetical protein n=1 Tax=unclassified Streptomyces TaxID=2593676 RepID=UPI00069185E6|nr:MULTISPECIES: hypothetical protein [unclassified Streptomyces]